MVDEENTFPGWMEDDELIYEYVDDPYDFEVYSLGGYNNFLSKYKEVIYNEYDLTIYYIKQREYLLEQIMNKKVKFSTRKERNKVIKRLKKEISELYNKELKLQGKKMYRSWDKLPKHIHDYPNDNNVWFPYIDDEFDELFLN